jgi:hypothetical protein
MYRVSHLAIVEPELVGSEFERQRPRLPGLEVDSLEPTNSCTGSGVS